ncbi:hypothetical protein [Motilibacter aurantiacus]|uniref:hypothetical protein n=1 Tax=Motilibacter aurantiacus TaxID=2714955 RepID=UPI00140D2E9F|nr:hypothetical protein [Motilibacter aurantiacus]NHC46482.1 hypothetical protein [Motilibacter aurantiacus]
MRRSHEELARRSAQRSESQSRIASRPTPGELPTARVILLLYGVIALAVLPYVVGVLAPYYAHDLDELPYSELTSGRHDPKWLTGTSDISRLAGYVSLPLMPLTALGVLALVLHLAVREDGARRRLSRSPGKTATLGALVLMCLTICAYQFTAMENALSTWILD